MWTFHWENSALTQHSNITGHMGTSMWAGRSMGQGWQWTMEIRRVGNETRNVIRSRRCSGCDKWRDVSAAGPYGNDVHEICGKLATWSEKCRKVTSKLDLCQSILQESSPSSTRRRFSYLCWKTLFWEGSDSIDDSSSYPFLRLWRHTRTNEANF